MPQIKDLKNDGLDLLSIESEIRLDFQDNTEVIIVDRADFISQKVGSIKKTGEGYLSGNAAIAKVGILTYALSDGTMRKELVPESTLFNRASMDSLGMKPITNQHPPEILLHVDNVKRRKVGFTGETIKRDNQFLTTSMTITDSDAIRSIDAGTLELSPGYKAEVVLQDGMFEGERYDAVQVRRTYNHVAICDKARGGSDLRLNLDSIDKIDGVETEKFSDNTNFNKPKLKPKKGDSEMPTLNIRGVDYEATQEVCNAYRDAVDKIDSLETEATALTQTHTDSIAERQGKLDASEAKVKELEGIKVDEMVQEGVTTRLDLYAKASRVLDKETMKKIDSMSNFDIMKAVILVKTDKEAIETTKTKLDSKDTNEIYILARFDGVIAGLPKEKSSVASQREQVTSRSDSVDDNDDPVLKARNDMVDRQAKAYQDKKDKE